MAPVPARPRGPKGQVALEFILAAAAFLIILFGTMDAAISSFQRTMVDYRIATIADSLPAGFSTADSKSLVRDLLTERGGLDPSRLTVDSAHVSVESHGGSYSSDSLAQALGSENSMRKVDYVKVSARVTYRVSGIGFLNPGPYTREFTKSLALTRRYEIS